MFGWGFGGWLKLGQLQGKSFSCSQNLNFFWKDAIFKTGSKCVFSLLWVEITCYCPEIHCLEKRAWPCSDSQYTWPLKNKKGAIDEMTIVILQGALITFGSPEDAFPKALLICKHCWKSDWCLRCFLSSLKYFGFLIFNRSAASDNWNEDEVGFDL